MRKIDLVPNKYGRCGFTPIAMIGVEWNEKIESYVANIVFRETPFIESNHRLGVKLYGENEEAMEKMIKNAAKICSVARAITVLVPNKE